MNTISFAFRSLLKSPGFTLVAVFALALGIGANSAIFSIIDAIFLRPLPYAQADQLVQLTSAQPERGLAQGPMSWPRMQAVRERQQVFTDISISTPSAFIVTVSGDPEQLQGMIVSQNYFPLLGVQPLLGRNFIADGQICFHSRFSLRRPLSIWSCRTLRRIRPDDRKSLSLKFMAFRPAMRFWID